MALTSEQIAQSILKVPMYRGYYFKYKLRWAIGHFLCQHPWYVETYFAKPIHEHYYFIEEIEEHVRTLWQEKAKETRRKTQAYKHHHEQVSRQGTLFN